MNAESLCKSYRPQKVDILFVGESAPASGKFFYDKSNMTTYTSKAFEETLSKSFHSTLDFLNYFKSTGCFLDDLSLVPVDKMDKRDRELVLEKSINALADRIKEYDPSVIIIVLKKIEKYVNKAISKSKVTPVVHTLPFPGNGHQNKYIKELSKLLRKHINTDT